MSKPHRTKKFLTTGHAPGHLRDCLGNALLDHEGDWWRHLEMNFMRERHQRWWDSTSASDRAYWLIGQLWNCTDTVPSELRESVRDWLEDEYFSYARLVRALKADLDAPNSETPKEAA